MNHSARYVSMPTIPPAHFLECVRLAIVRNAAYVPPHDSAALLYIRPLLLGTGAQPALNPPREYTFCVYVTPAGAYHGLQPVDALILDDFDRAAPRGTGAAKIGGNYAPVMRWSDAARRDGYALTLHLDSQTRSEIEEFSTSGFLGIQHDPHDADRCTLVVPDSNTVIESVTSESCVQLAKSFGWTVEKRPVRFHSPVPPVRSRPSR